MTTLNHEVELRALISAEEGQALIARLRATGAEERGQVCLRDVYFCPKAVTDFAALEMDAVGSYSLRLRRQQKGGVETITINSKTITHHGDHSAWEEHETCVDSFHEAALLLLRTEFQAFFQISKTRHVFLMSGMSINVEDIEDFGFAVEIEKMATEATRDAAKTEVLALMESLGIPADRLAEKSVTNLLMKQLAFRQEIEL